LDHPLGLLRRRTGQLCLELLHLVTQPTRLIHAAHHTHNGEL
jgi:hypothetical protein